MTYRCRHFKIYELVSNETYHLFKEHFGEEHFEEFLWRLLDEGLLRSIDEIRDNEGSVTVNDWFWGGGYNESGLRIPIHEYYSSGSAHTQGKGADLKFEDTTPERVREKLRSDPPKWLTRIENNTKSWLHCDTMPTSKDYLYFFNP